jgi:adenylate cyclase
VRAPSHTVPKRPQRLGEYLDVPEERIVEALEQWAPAGVPRPRIGQILSEAGLVDRSDLIDALHRQRRDRLRACALFAGVGEDTLLKLAPMAQEVSVHEGHQFIFQDQVERHFFVLVSGRALIYRTDETGTEVELNVNGPGEPLGELGYFAGGRRSASARALEDTELLQIDYADLSRCFELAPELAIQLLDTVAERLRRQSLLYEESAQGRKQAERSLRHLSDFLNLSEASQLGQGIEKLIEQIVHTASRVMEADRATLFLLDRTHNQLWSLVAEDEGRRQIRIPADAGIAGWVVEHGEVLNVPDAYADERFNRDVDLKTGYRTRNLLTGPVRSFSGELIGVVQVINKEKGTFGESDEALFKAFCHQAAVAVENYNLYSRLMDSHRKMAAMLEVANSVNDTLELEALIHKVVEKLVEILGCDRASFFVLDRTAGELWSMDAYGSSAEIRFPANVGLAGHVASTGEVLNIADAYGDPRFNPEIDRRSGYRTRTVLAAPVLNRDGEVIGVTQAINKKSGRFENDDEELLEALCSQIAVALENAQLFADTVEMRNYLDNVQQSISNAIITLDNARHVITVNRAARAMLRRSEEACVGRPVDAVLGTGNEAVLALLDEVAGEKTRVSAYDLRFTPPEGVQASVNAHALDLTDADGRQQGYVLVLEDITQEMRVRATLNRYMATELVEQVLSEPELHLGGARSEASVLFCDIRDFTSLSEQLSADQTMEFLNSYFTLMVDEVFGNQGVLDKFMGDALMAVFGVPVVRHDDAVRCVRTALGMLQRLEGLNAGRLRQKLLPIRVGIGINTGEIISGNLGSEKRMEFTVVGDGVNVSSRLEGLNKLYGTQILVSDHTREQVGDAFETREVDLVRVKGRSAPLRIHEVIGPRGAARTPGQERFAEGYALYHERRFSEAAKIFADGSRSDGPCQVFHERCRTFRKDPPPADWDGVWEALHK